MKKIKYITPFFLLLLLNCSVANSQKNIVDSFQKILRTQKEDTSKLQTLLALGESYYLTGHIDSVLIYSRNALSLAEKLQFKKGQINAFVSIGNAYQMLNNFTQARLAFDSALMIAEELNDKNELAAVHSCLGTLSNWEDNYAEALDHHYKSLKLSEETGSNDGMGRSYMDIGYIHYNQGDYSEALKSQQASLDAFKKGGNQRYIAFSTKNVGDAMFKTGNYPEALEKFEAALLGFEKFSDGSTASWIASTYTSLGNVYEAQGKLLSQQHKEVAANEKFTNALRYYEQSLTINKETNFNVGESYLNLGNIYMRLKNFPEAEKDLQQCLWEAKKLNSKSDITKAYLSLSELDSIRGNFEQAYSNYKNYTLYRDSVINETNIKKSTQIKLQYEFDKKEVIAKAVEQRRRNKQYIIIILLASLVLFFILATTIQWRNNKLKKKANMLLIQQKEKIESTLTELKSTQSQLIQSEKMASLGELTAGIAHEIQNPLNFVNNFSEVSNELIDEMNIELDKGDINEAKAIAADVKQNLEKINHHGKRADAIVKGMLQHSRSSSGQKEPTNINALADEYLRLAYHGLRAKDKSFNATLKTDFDESIGNINIIPQDIGRVILNLITNAFYAVAEKKKQSPDNYEPTVTVKTSQTPPSGGRGVIISVSDNGNGIPAKVLDKIFQPFFTTKPTGQGTGLGLSLSYDIVKAHGGELKVETKEEEYTTFIIILPNI